MVSRVLTILGAGLVLARTGTALAQTSGAATPAAPPSVQLPVPVMEGPLAFSPVPPAVKAGALGTWYVDGVASGLVLQQENADRGDRDALGDFGNAQIFIQKIDGVVRAYVQLGAYALPALGAPYTHAQDASTAVEKLFGPVPQAFIKIAPSDSFSIQAGKLPTLLGDEYTFTFENIDIARGLLWNQEPAVSRGVQGNLVLGAAAFSLSLNDGFYAGRYSWLSGSASWTINPADVLVLAAGANLRATARNDLATPRNQNNSRIINLIYTHTQGPLMVSPYVQYSQVPRLAAIGIDQAASLGGAAVLASYALTPALTLGARGEYEASLGAGHTDLLYGPGSHAASLTLSPTYTMRHWFLRGDLALVGLGHAAPREGFGPAGQERSQLRMLIEAGYLF